MDDEELWFDLSSRLKDAYSQIASLKVSDDEKARITRRLIAITDASKRDLGRASARLDGLLSDLDAGWLPDPRDP